jgi:hypothetical protein
MHLFIGERLTILGLLPAQGNHVTLRIVRELREALSFTEEELEACEITQKDNQIVWNTLKDEGKEIVIGNAAREVIVKVLKEKDAAESLNPVEALLYEKFGLDT